MYIKKLIVQNYRSLKDVDIDFNDELNIMVGDNETGKSTLLEAINLVLRGQLNGRSIHYELHPFLFNNDVTRKYIDELKDRNNSIPPEIVIEVYLKDESDLARLKGTNNSLKDNQPGVSLKIEFDDTYNGEYSEYIKNPEQVKNIPIEYYKVTWRSFADENITSRSIPIKPLFIDASKINNNLGPNRYIINIVRDLLTPEQLAEASLSYRRLKDTFSDDSNIQKINARLSQKRGEITDKDLSISLDTMSKSGWDSGIAPHLNEIPLPLIGKGEQSTIKIKLAMELSDEKNIFLIEEPENHLSFTNLNTLISRMYKKAQGKQLIITTHSNFVLNKLGVGNVLFFNGNRCMTLKDLDEETHDYFMRLPGHNTLRLILAKKAVLVEGPSDELIVQKAFLQEYNEMPLECGVDVITVASLAFKRFLEIAEILEIDTVVVTDNDGDVIALRKKYKDYCLSSNIRICYDSDECHKTLELQLLKANDLDILNEALGKKYADEKTLLKYMTKNKTEYALRLFETNVNFTIPEYIKNAIKQE